jgi:uncharacterized alkaline shock family protein YloU
MSVGLWPIRDFMADIEFYRWPWLALLSVLLLIISFKYLFLSIVPPRIQSTLLKNTDMGMIRVSVNTLDSIAQKAVRNFAEVKDVKTSVIPEMDGVRVRVVLFIMPDVNIPDLTLAVQAKVKEQIEDISGILAKEVQVYVENVPMPQRGKIE